MHYSQISLKVPSEEGTVYEGFWE